MFYVVSPEILINKVFWLISCLLVWLFTANSEVLLKFFFFAFGLSKSVVFAQIWALFPYVCELRALLVFSWSSLQTLPPLVLGNQRPRVRKFSLQDAEELQHFCDSVTILLSVPVAFFQHLQTKRPTSSIHCLPAVFTNTVAKTQQIISWVWWSVQFDFCFFFSLRLF